MKLSKTISKRIIESTGSNISRAHPLTGGCLGDVRLVELVDDRQVVAKIGAHDQKLAIEGFMLHYLATNSRLPVPEVLVSEEDLLILQFLPSDGHLDKTAEINAADAVANLHRVTQEYFGFECDTAIGGLPQPNPLTKSWPHFFRDARLCYMADQAVAEKKLPVTLRHRIDYLSGRLESLIGDTTPPALLHGDLWRGNILCARSGLVGFIDPAIYFGHPEIELAFTTLFNTFGPIFFDRYQEHHKITPGFLEERRDLYNLYPLLVHARLFGNAYLDAIDQTLVKYGC